MEQSIILNFHGIGSPSRPLDPGEADAWLSPSLFESVLDAAMQRDDVRITFDDGNTSDLELALPALQRRGLRATFFVVAGRMGMPGFLSQDDVLALEAAGMTIGSHGMLHRPWRGLDYAGLEAELHDARRMLEDIVQRPVTQAACPFGSYDRRVLRALRSNGYDAVYTSDRGLSRPGDWLQARNTVGAGDDAAVLERILEAQRSPSRVLYGRAKLLAKRWR
jgi:peptidoglycan/xylan/chitin deacetylase (PgdA/CDA1 family)